MIGLTSLIPASIPSPDPAWDHFTIGPITIRTYALCILLGIVIAAVWTSRRLTKRGAEPGIVLDIMLWAVPLGIIGARAYHVFTHPADYFFPGADLWKTLFIWEGGNAIFGALLGGAVGAIIGCRMSGLRFWSFADALAPGLLLAQAFGRLGNYINHELFGLPTDLPWGLQIESTNPAFPAGLPDGTLFHPLFLYEMIWNVVGVGVILFLERRYHLRWGTAFGVYLIWYGAGRSYLESIRIDPSEYSFLSIPSNVWAAFAAVLLGIIVILVQRRRHPGLEPSVYRPGKAWRGPQDDDVDSQFLDSEVAAESLSPEAAAESPTSTATSS